MNVLLISLRSSFMVRVVGATTFFLIMTTMALNAYFSLQAASRLKSSLIHHSQSLVRSLARSSRVAVFTGSTEQLAAAASHMTTDQECQLVVFYDENGIPLFHYKGKSYQQSLEVLADQTLASHLRDQPKSASFFSEAGLSLIMAEPVLAEPKYSADQLFEDSASPAGSANQPTVIGHAMMVIDSSSIRRETRSMFIRDTGITIAITLLGCLFILAVISRAVAGPLRGLVGEIRRLQGGDGASRQESIIPSDFAEMIAILRTSYNTIHELKNTLEEKVAERTQQLKVSNQELLAQKNALADTLGQLRAAQTQLVQSEKMAALGMMISGLSHEIKNSINFIASSLPLLEMTIASALKEGGECPAARLNVLLANIREGVDRTIRVVSDLATFCHEGGSGFIATDILPGLKSSVAIVRREFGSRIAINEEHARFLPMVKGMAGQLNQVFLNIMLNAAQSISGSGTITVKSWEEDGAVHVSFADTGHGIDNAVIGRIFDPFFTTKEVGKGTGLGLSISYSTIKNHGGDILVRSEKGHGSIFEIILPV